MHLILLSGGSGKRLWPLSNDVRSKQFLKLLDAPNGEKESMVQRVYRQLQEVGGWDSITVAASAAQRDQLELQLGKDINLVIEPERRDTFPAIALACSYLYSEKHVNEKEAVAVLPVDPYVGNDYFEKIKLVEPELEIIGSGGLILQGAIPLFPSEKYGYIIPKKGTNEVKFFKEKPNAILAQGLIDQGALWNCGVFGFRLGHMLDILKDRYQIRDFSYDSMKETFKTLKRTSFDYEVVEHAQTIRMLRYAGPWKDLGTWETFTEEIKEGQTGNAIIDASCRNTHVINEQELPVMALGLNDIVVVASHDGILIANKGQTYRLKDLTAELKYRPMYEERRWGSYVVLDRSKDESAETLTKRISLTKDGQISYQYHEYRKEIWTILSGDGILYLEGEKKSVFAGQVIEIDVGVKHGLRALTALEMIEVQMGSQLVEEDIVRLEYDWQ